MPTSTVCCTCVTASNGPSSDGMAETTSTRGMHVGAVAAPAPDVIATPAPTANTPAAASVRRRKVDMMDMPPLKPPADSREREVRSVQRGLSAPQVVRGEHEAGPRGEVGQGDVHARIAKPAADVTQHPGPVLHVHDGNFLLVHDLKSS